MEVPNFMRSVRRAAAANTVMLSKRAPPVVIHTASIPFCSARSMSAKTPCAVAPPTARPTLVIFLPRHLFIVVVEGPQPDQAIHSLCTLGSRSLPTNSMWSITSFCCISG